MKRYKSYRIIDGKPKWVILDDNMNIVDKDPSKAELKYITPELYKKETYSEGYLLGLLMHFNKNEGRPPRMEDFTNNPKYPSFHTYQNIFGGWNNAIAKAGLLTNQRSKKETYSEEYLLERLAHFNNKEGIPPRQEDFSNNPEYPNYSTYWRVFGSWTNAIKKAGLIPNTTNGTYNETNTCDKIRKVGFSWKRCGNRLIREENPHREYKDGKWTGKWLCRSCYVKPRNRIGKNSNSPKAKADNSQELTCELFDVKDLNKENDNYCSPIDHSPIHEGVSITIGRELVDLSGRILQTKCALYDPINRYWSLDVVNEHNKDFDFLVTYCISRDGKKIERIYIIRWEEVMRHGSIKIIKNLSKGGWYRHYEIKDIEILKKANDLWEKILEKNKQILYQHS